MVMEYVSGGELFDYIVKKGKVIESNDFIYFDPDSTIAFGDRS